MNDNNKLKQQSSVHGIEVGWVFHEAVKRVIISKVPVRTKEDSKGCFIPEVLRMWSKQIFMKKQVSGKYQVHLPRETARAERMERGGCIQTLRPEDETELEQKEGLKGCLDLDH